MTYIISLYNYFIYALLAGQERFRSITRSYYRNSVGALLLFDTTNYDSFEHINDWLQEAKKQIEPNNAIFMLVGTKVDKEHLREGIKLIF